MVANPHATVVTLVTPTRMRGASIRLPDGPRRKMPLSEATGEVDEGHVARYMHT